MKHFYRFILSICAVWLLSSCVDDAYNLSNIEDGDIALGGNDSEFFMPLASISYAASNIQINANEEMSAIELYDRINIWIPSTLPGNATYIDLQQLKQPAYKNSILNALYDEMEQQEQKRLAVCLHVMECYKPGLIEMLQESGNATLALAAQHLNTITNQEGSALLATLFAACPNEIRTVFNELSDNDLLNYNIQDARIRIPSLDISEEVETMLSDNLDPMQVTNPTNALYLFGDIYSDFPFLCHFNPYILESQINLGKLSVDKQVTTPIQEVRIYKEDLQTLINGSFLVIPITLERYYPHADFNENSKLDISISLRKTGGLTL